MDKPVLSIFILLFPEWPAARRAIFFTLMQLLTAQAANSDHQL